MRIKIKAKPEDFAVEEIASLPLVNKGEYGAYLLKKKGWNTIDLLLELSRRLNIPFTHFSYGGRKDRYALTSQYISIKSPGSFDLREKNYSLMRVGVMERPMGPDLIRGNKFEIAVRKLNKDDTDKIASLVQNAGSNGYPNYFDDQRFGSFDSRQGFFAEKLLRQQFNGALKIYLARVYSTDNQEEKERKNFFFERWKDWEACLKKAKTRFEKRAFAFLARNPSGFLEVLKGMPRHELSAFIASYQAYLWNEMLRRLIKQELPGPFKNYSGLAGEYIFFTDFDENENRYFRNLTIPVPGAKPKTEDALVKKVYLQVMEANNLKNSVFNKVNLRRAFFKSFGRLAMVKPDGLNFDFLDDELYPGRKKLRLKFQLPRGSYATMFIKRIFCSTRP